MPFDFVGAGAWRLVPVYRRCADGLPDYDHYRRAAARLRAQAFARLLGGATRALAGTVLEWRARARARRDLAAMDERLRRDIGLSRFDVVHEASKPFWRA